MGQSLSYDSTTKKLYLTTELPDSQIVGIRLIDSGLARSMVAVAPGWNVDNNLTLWFEPNRKTNGVNVTTWNYADIATLTRAPGSNTLVGSVSKTQGLWATSPIEFSNSAALFELLCPAYVIIGEGFFRVGDVATTSGSNVTYMLTGSQGRVQNDVLLLTRELSVGTHVLTLTATSGQGNTSSRSITVVVQLEEITVPNVGTSLNLNAQNQFDLYPGIFDSGNDIPTHATLLLNSTVSVTWAGTSYTAQDTSMVTVSRAELGSITVRFLSDSVARGVRRSGILTYWLSFDGGLCFTKYGAMSIDQFPCFDTDSRVCVGFQKGVMQWRRVLDLKPGDTVVDCEGHKQTVRRVSVSQPIASHVVHIARDAIVPGVPNRNLFVTTNHRLRVPEGGSSSQRLRAGILPTLYRHTRLDTVNKPICHIETDMYCFLWVDRLMAESWARTPAQLAQREGHSLASLQAAANSVPRAVVTLRRHTHQNTAVVFRPHQEETTAELRETVTQFIPIRPGSGRRPVSMAAPVVIQPKPAVAPELMPVVLTAVHSKRRGAVRQQHTGTSVARIMIPPRNVATNEHKVIVTAGKMHRRRGRLQDRLVAGAEFVTPAVAQTPVLTPAPPLVRKPAVRTRGLRRK